MADPINSLVALADEWDALAEQNDLIGEAHLERGNDTGAQRAFGSRDAHRSCARALREEAAAATSTTTHKE